MSLIAYRTLGRSGLSISPLALGTMTFGTSRWGSGEDASRAVFNAYVDAGGNFVDTADVYSGGRSDKRLDGANPFGDSLFTERNWKIVDALKDLASQAGQSPARVALAWVTGRPGVASTLMGVSRVEQVADNVAALDLVLSPEHRAALDAVSAPPQKMVYSLFTPTMRQHAVFGGSVVMPWRQ